MLTKDDILFLLKLLERKVVIPEDQNFPFEITRREMGYSSDPTVSKLQAKLSIMLEVASSGKR